MITHTAPVREHRWTGHCLHSVPDTGRILKRRWRPPGVSGSLHSPNCTLRMGAPVCVTPPSRAQSWAVAPLWADTEQHQVVLGSESLSPLFGMASKAIVPHRVTSAPCTCHGREGHGWGLAILASTLGIWLGSSLKAKPFPLWAFCSASHRSLSLLCWNTNK